MKILKYILLFLILPSICFAGYRSDGWGYRGSITLPDPGDGNPRFFSSANLDANITDYSYGNGADLRWSSDADGDTPIAFAIMYPLNPFKSVAVAVPEGVSTIYYWVGKEDADFIAPDDTYGSEAVWGDAKAAYMFDAQEAPAITTDGAFNPIGSYIHDPSCAYYNGVYYFAYSGDDLDPYILTYTVSTDTWSSAVKIGTNPLPNTDDHGPPIIALDNSGYIHCTYGAHLSAFEYSISDSPEDISSWTSQTDIGIGKSLTYAHTFKTSDNVMRLICRDETSASECLYVMYSDADSFTSSTTLIQTWESNSRIYAGRVSYDATNNHIWLAWNVHRTDDLRYDLYVGYYDLDDSKMYAFDGTDLGATVSGETDWDACMVIDSGTNITGVPFSWLDPDGDLNVIQVQETATDYDARYIKYSSGSWSTPEVITQTGGTFNMAAGYHSDSTTVEAYVVTDDATSTRGGSLEHWQRSGSSWAKIRTVYDYTEPRISEFVGAGVWGSPKIIHNAPSSGPHVMFAEGNTTGGDFPVYVIDEKDNYMCGSVTSHDAATAGVAATVSDSTVNTADASGLHNGYSGGKVGDTLSLDGSSEYITMPSGIITDRTQYTLAGWVYIDGDSPNETTDKQNIIGMYADMDVLLQYSEDDDASNASELRLLSYSTAYDANDYTTATFAYDTWYYMALVYDLSDNMTLYVNGDSELVVSSIPTPRDSNQYSRFGYDTGSTVRNFLYGNLDTWMIYNSALSETELDILYNNQNDVDNYPTSTTALIQVNVPIVPYAIFY